MSACGDDEILKKAAADRAAREAAGSVAGVPPGGSVGEPGAPAVAHQPGIPEEPTPVSPTEPPAVQLGAGVPTDPAPAPLGVGTPGTPPPIAPGDPAPVAPGDPAPGAPGDPVPGRAADPVPGKPVEPAPHNPGSPAGIPGVPPTRGGGGGGVTAPSGPLTTVTGLISFPEWRAGAVRITAFDGEHAMAQGRQVRVVAEARIDRPGGFTMQVPEDAGSLYIEAAVDEDGDGRPGPLDPQGRADPYPIRVRTDPVTGVTIRLSRRAPPEDQPKDDF